MSAETDLDDAPAPRPTPDATIEAMSFALREGPKCLRNRDDLDRLRTIDLEGMEKLIRKLDHPNRIGVRWTQRDVEVLLSAWRPAEYAPPPDTPGSLAAGLDNLGRMNAATNGLRGQ